MSRVDDAIAVLRAGGLALLPTDTVYGLAADGRNEAAASSLYAAKGRDVGRPTALVFASIELLDELLPALPAVARRAAGALLPGALTLILPNPARSFAWLNPERPEALGVRVPTLAGPGRVVLDAVGALVATSANLPGGQDPRRLEDVPPELLESVDAAVDGGTLPGTPSTVVDLTGGEPAILREGAIPAREVLARLSGLTDR